MSNSLYNAMGRQNNPLEQLAQQARDFRKQFSGNPRQEVERLLASGRMSQADFNRYSQIAQQVAQFMGDN
jgi:very-short-patch-repair endonuclease